MKYYLRCLLFYFLIAIVAVLLSTEVGFPLFEIFGMTMVVLSLVIPPIGVIVLVIGMVRKNEKRICHGLGLTLASLFFILCGFFIRYHQQIASEKKAGKVIEAINKYAQFNGSFPKSLEEVPGISIGDKTTVIGIFKTHKYHYVPVRNDYDLFFYIPGLRIDSCHWLCGWEISNPSWRRTGKVPEFVR